MARNSKHWWRGTLLNLAFTLLRPLKDPHFLYYLHETLWKWFPHEMIIFTKFYEDWGKNVDFLLMANFWMCLVFSSNLEPMPCCLKAHYKAKALILSQCISSLYVSEAQHSSNMWNNGGNFWQLSPRVFYPLSVSV